MKIVNTSVSKKDSMALLSGKPVYCEDLAPANCLIVKVLRSPHANAIVAEVDTKAALLVPGVVAIYTWEDVDQNMPRFTSAGQTYPETSAHDRLVLDRHVRYAGDAVALIAAETEEAAERARKLIKVRYDVLPAVLDYHTAKDNPVLVHPEENWECFVSVGADNRRNLVSTDIMGDESIDGILSDCDVVIDRTYHTKAVNQVPMETFRAYCYIDAYSRLVVVASTQISFHVRRIIARALGIPASRVRSVKPRIGGGFGAKQTLVCEFFPAFVTWKTKRPCKLVYTREEALIASSPRHQMETHVRLGASRDGKIRAIEMNVLSDSGAYSEHGFATAGLVGTKAISMYRKLEGWRFTYDVVYTNHQAAGAYRGFGATQGVNALESAVNELADRLKMDPIELRLKNVVKQGDIMPAYYGERNTSCRLDDCLKKVREMSHWDERFPVRDLKNGKVRSMGLAMALQGSCISGIDVGSCRIKLNDEGHYTILSGVGDMGQGADTVLSQIAAEVLMCPYENIVILSGDTDASAYDSGSYASSTTFITGKTVEMCAHKLIEKIKEAGASCLGVPAESVDFDGSKVFSGESSISLEELVWAFQCGHDGMELEAFAHHSNPASPPPVMAAAVEVEIDTLTGETKVLEYNACIDCGTPINPNLVKIQVEGGALQGIGMALYEDINYGANGMPREKSLMQYRIPTRLDAPRMNVEFAPSFEEQGPFGAKSCGEVVLNPPAPAIQEAVFNATGKRFYELPITAEQIAMAFEERDIARQVQ